MPQLDKVTFLSQFFWLCVFFLGFYVVSLKYFLPQLGRVLKYRKKRLSNSDQGVNTTQEENDKVRYSTDKLLENGFKSSKELFNRNLQRTENWLMEYTNRTNQTKLKDTNYNYLHSLGEKSLSHNLSLRGGFCDFSSALFVTVLISKFNTSATSSVEEKPGSSTPVSMRAQAKSFPVRFSPVEQSEKRTSGRSEEQRSEGEKRTSEGNGKIEKAKRRPRS